MFPTGYTVDNLNDMIASNDSCPTLPSAQVERLIDLAEQVFGGNQFESDGQVHIVATDWGNFASDTFGTDTDDLLNQFALGVYDKDVSMGRDALLFTDTVIVQTNWLRSGDGRRTQIERFQPDFEGADVGDMWVPKSVTDYIAIISIADELVYEQTAAGAM